MEIFFIAGKINENHLFRLGPSKNHGELLVITRWVDSQQLQAARAAAERWKAKYMELKDKESAQPKAPGPDSAEVRVSKQWGG